MVKEIPRYQNQSWIGCSKSSTERESYSYKHLSKEERFQINKLTLKKPEKEQIRPKASIRKQIIKITEESKT